MNEEQLAHAFDLFYTSSKSRSGKEKHMGMGLFLAKKILELHGLSLALENTGNGIRAVIRRKGVSGKEKPALPITYKKIFIILLIALFLVFSGWNLISDPGTEQAAELEGVSFPEPEADSDKRNEYRKEAMEKRLQDTIRLMAENTGEVVYPLVSIQNLDTEDHTECTASVILYLEQGHEISDELRKAVKKLIIGSIEGISLDNISITVQNTEE